MDSDALTDTSADSVGNNVGINPPLESPFKLTLKPRSKKINLPSLSPLSMGSSIPSSNESTKSLSPASLSPCSTVSSTDERSAFGFSPLPSPSTSTKSLAFNPLPFTLNVKKINRPIPQVNGSSTVGLSTLSSITKDSSPEQIIAELQREITSLKNEIESKDSKLSSSMRSIKTFWSPELKKERAARKEDMERYILLKEQYNSVCDQSKKLSAEVQELKQELSSVKNSNNTVTDTKVLSADNDLEQLKQANERQEDEIFILHKTIEDLEEKVKCYKEQLSSKDYIVSNLETKFTDTIASHNEQIKSKDEMIATVKNEFKMLEKKLGDFKSTEDSLIDKHKEANKSEIKTLLETLEMKEKEIQRLKEDFKSSEGKEEELQRIIQSKEETVQELRSNVSELFEQVKELRDQHKEEKKKKDEDIKSYRNQTIDIKKKMESLQNDFSKKELELSSIKSDYETMKAHGDSQLEKEQALRDTLSAKDQTVKTLQKEVATLKMRLDEKDGIIKDKEVIITSMSASKTRETSELDELKVLVQARDREIDALNTQITALKTSSDEKDGVIKDKEIMLTSMSTLKSRENSELDELKGLLQARDREIESLNAKYASLDNYLTDRETALSHVREELSELKSTYSDSKSSITILESQISEKDLRIAQLEKQKDRLERDKDEEVKAAWRDKDEMKLKLKRMKSELREKDEQVQTLEQTCEKLKIDVNQRDQQILVLEDSRKIDNVDVEELRDQISNYQETIRGLESQLSDKNETIERLEKDSMRSKEVGKRDSGHGATQAKDSRMIKQLWDEISKKDNRIQELEKQLREKGKQLTNMRRSQTVERGRQALHMTDKMKQDSEADVQMSQLQDEITRKENRIAMLEDALRESVSIAAEREDLLAQHVEMSENAAEKIQELESNQDRVIMEKGITNIKNAFLILSLSERDAVVGALRAARRRNIEELLNIKQTALLSSISEKDANIALLEIQSSSKSRKQEIKQLKCEKDKLVSDLKEQTQHRMTVVNNEDNKEGSLYQELNDAPNELILETLRHLSDSSDKLEFYVEELIAFAKDRNLEILKDLPTLPKRTQKPVDKLRGSSKQELLRELQKSDSESSNLKGYVDVVLEKLEG